MTKGPDHPSSSKRYSTNIELKTHCTNHIPNSANIPKIKVTYVTLRTVVTPIKFNLKKKKEKKLRSRH